MSRPQHDTPTEGELEILKVLWERGPSTGRQVWQELNHRRRRAYTSVMTLLSIMADKGYVEREQQGRAFVYRAKRERGRLQGTMVGNLLHKVFDGSASLLVAQVLEQSKPSAEELAEIRRAIEEWQGQEKAP